MSLPSMSETYALASSPQAKAKIIRVNINTLINLLSPLFTLFPPCCGTADDDFGITLLFFPAGIEKEFN
jgi:hypothetical protein